MPTGHMDAGNDCYVMHWPGLLAVYPAAAAESAMQQGKTAPSALGGAAAPAAKRLCIFAGSAGDVVHQLYVQPSPQKIPHTFVPGIITPCSELAIS